MGEVDAAGNADIPIGWLGLGLSRVGHDRLMGRAQAISLSGVARRAAKWFESHCRNCNIVVSGINSSPDLHQSSKEVSMQALKKQLQQNPSLLFFSVLLFAFSPAMAESDMQTQEKVLKAREMAHTQHTDHATHVNPIDKSLDFHGVFYGFLPCKDCNGIKATLSLKQNNNYLLVTQPARESSREYYEKGKYSWNEENQTVVLTPRKEELATRQYYIENEGTLVQLNSDGMRIKGDEADRYTLRRSDTVKARQVHIH